MSERTTPSRGNRETRPQAEIPAKPGASAQVKIAYGIEGIQELADRPRRVLSDSQKARQIARAGDVILSGAGRPEEVRRRYRRQYVRSIQDVRRVAPAIDSAAALRGVPRPRGAGRPRAAATRSSAASGDSGDDGESEPPEPRLCACGCGSALDDLRRDARFAKPACRKRAQRKRDRTEPERAVERLLANGGPVRTPELCRCKPRGLVLPDEEQAPVCASCGRPCRPYGAAVNGFDGVDRLMRANGTVTRRRLLNREWRTRPSRGLSSKLRRTKRTYWVEGVAA